jgi:hypothetical protein
MKKNKIIFLLLIVFATINVSAQIVYTDINPDSDFTNGGSIDFNNDGTAELSTSNGEYFPGPFFFLHYGDATSGWDVPKPLPLNFIIDANSGWMQYAGDCSMGNWGSGTHFPLNEDAYMGVKFTISDTIHYAWVRIMWNGTKYIYKDYAYESSSNTAIKAGETVVSIKEPSVIDNITIYPNPAKNKITVEAKYKLNNSKITVVNLLGKVLIETILTDIILE